MLYRLLESWESLPRAGESLLQERVWFDLKITYPPKRGEIAKDIAAFANSSGGVIIVGANEGPVEPDYSSPLSAEHAATIESCVDEAVRDFCRPSPTVHVRAIRDPSNLTKVVLAINVEPAVDQPVAARHESDANAWRFPLRVGRHTEYVLPDQLPAYMNSKSRRAKLLLLRAQAAGGHVDLFTVPSGLFKRGDMQCSGRFALDAVDPNDGGSFMVRDIDGSLDHQSVAIPIDDVEAVWLQHTGLWAVRVAGRLEQMTGLDDGAAYELTYVPPMTFVVSPLEKVVEQLSEQVKKVGRILGGTLAVQHFPRKEPEHGAIAERAHRLWQLRSSRGQPGTSEGDWFRARRELLAEDRQS